MSELIINEYEFGIDKPSIRRVYTVKEITHFIKLSLEEKFSQIWIEGEISNLKWHTSGHLYFSLKDKETQIACVMWRGKNQNLPFQPQDGMKILVFGNITVYERQGRYQIDVQRIQPVGVGELQLAFEDLKKHLNTEGLFSAEHKKFLPEFPKHIGIVTSESGAAIKDIVSIITRRFPSSVLILKPVRVQGIGAAEDIVEAIQDLNAYGRIDVIIVGRGGGAIEDLWAFNEEIVARAIFHSRIPVISAVGHEIDFFISDFVADVRAATPSAAAELVVRDKAELLQSIIQWQERMKRSIQNLIDTNREKIAGIEKSYAFRFPINRIQEFQQRIDDIWRHLEIAMSRQFDKLKMSLNQLNRELHTLNPDAVLKRGYSITSRLSDNKIIHCSLELKENEKIRTRLYKGSVKSVVEKIDES
jgi:exodeoxyribonuclease VII large subunit